MKMSTKRSLFLAAMIISKTLTKTLTEKCTVSGDCKNYPYYTCSGSACVHKDIFPLMPMEIAGIILLTLLSMMATTAGVGGGAIVVPLSLIFLKFETKEAVALANGLVLFNGFVKFLNGLSKKHPEIAYRTIVDYNVVVLFLPSVLLGSVMGSVVSPTIPEILQIVGLVLVLVNAFFKGMKKSNALWRKENEMLKENKRIGEAHVGSRGGCDGQEGNGGGVDEEVSGKFLKIGDQNMMKSSRTIGGMTNGGFSKLKKDADPLNFEKVEKEGPNPKKQDDDKAKPTINVNSDSGGSVEADNKLASRRSFNNSYQFNLLSEKKGPTSSIGGVEKLSPTLYDKISSSKIEDLNKDLEEIRLKNKRITDQRAIAIPHKGTNDTEDKAAEAIHRKIRAIEGSNFSLKTFPFILTVLLTSLLVTFLRGGKGFESIIKAKKCSKLDWTIFTLYFTTIAIFSYIGSRLVISHQNLKQRVNFKSPENEKKIDKKFIITSNILGILIGFVSANIGIGGGLIITPLLLSYNFLPEVVSYTGMYLVFWNKLLSTFVFILSGHMPIFYMLFIGFFLIIGVLLVEWKVGNFIKRQGRQSIVSYAFVGIVLVSFLLVVYSGYRTVKGHIDGEVTKGILQFGDFCGEA